MYTEEDGWNLRTSDHNPSVHVEHDVSVKKIKLIDFLISVLLKMKQNLIPISSATTKEHDIAFPPGGLSIFPAD